MWFENINIIITKLLHGIIILFIGKTKQTHACTVM